MKNTLTAKTFASWTFRSAALAGIALAPTGTATKHWSIPARNYRWPISMSQTQATLILRMRTTETLHCIADFTAPLQGDTLTSATATEATSTLGITGVSVNDSVVTVDGVTIAAGCGVEIAITASTAVPRTTYSIDVLANASAGNVLDPICKLTVDP